MVPTCSSGLGRGMLNKGTTVLACQHLCSGESFPIVLTLKPLNSVSPCKFWHFLVELGVSVYEQVSLYRPFKRMQGQQQHSIIQGGNFCFSQTQIYCGLLFLALLLRAGKFNVALGPLAP